jgi:hypothetical protein
MACGAESHDTTLLVASCQQLITATVATRSILASKTRCSTDGQAAASEQQQIRTTVCTASTADNVRPPLPLTYRPEFLPCDCRCKASLVGAGAPEGKPQSTSAKRSSKMKEEGQTDCF